MFNWDARFKMSAHGIDFGTNKDGITLFYLGYIVDNREKKIRIE